MLEVEKKIHFVGVGGVAMGSLAQALSEYGYEVTGSDQKLYEPMKGVLARAKIRLIEGFDEATAAQLNPDLVVIGNVVRKENPEAVAWIRKGTPFCSFPEAVRRFLIRDKTSIVCSGTHGKTTTSSWIAFMMRELQTNPSYLIGGVPLDLPTGALITDGDYFVGEGDEYDSAFFDKGPKFLHYNPSHLIISNVEFDHADIYRDLAHVKASFEKVVSILPGDGLLVVRYDDQNAMDVAQLALCPVQTFGLGMGAMWKVANLREDEAGFHFDVTYKGKNVGTFKTPLFGEHNLMNLLSGIVVAVNLGMRIDRLPPIVEKFRNAKRRLEILATDPVLLIDDFAHHPTEVKASLSAVRRRYPQRRVFALFEPRSATARRSVHQGEYAQAFDSADKIMICTPFKAAELNSDQRLSSDDLVSSIKSRGKDARSFSSADEIVKALGSEYQPGDAIVVMSNGEFDKIQSKLLSVLK